MADDVDETTMLLRAMGARLCALLPKEWCFVMPDPGFVVRVERQGELPDPDQFTLFPVSNFYTVGYAPDGRPY